MGHVMPKLYTVGMQPLDIVSKRFEIVDLLNKVISNPDLTQIKPVLLSEIKQLKLEQQDYMLINSRFGRGLLPYCHFIHTFIIDTSYSPQKREVANIFNSISAVIGEENTLATYQTTCNSFRASLNLRLNNNPVQTSSAFNAMTLLSDLNKCTFGTFEKYITNMPIDNNKYTDYAIFVGDPIHPTFFDYLDSRGIKTISFFPYQFFTLPVTEPVDFYANSPLFQPPLSTLIEIRRLINDWASAQRHIKYIILNPRGIYLTEDEAQYYNDNLTDMEVFILPDYFKGVTLSV